MIALWFFILISILGFVACPCPPQEDIAPRCICKDLGDGPMMLCNTIMSTDELIPIIKATDSYDMFALTLMDSALPYIPSDLFKGTRYEKIRFVNTQIMSLSDGDLAFTGLEDRLEEIRATDAHYITQWEWSQLRNHRKLDLIDINLISMYSLDQEFPALKSLTVLGISKAEISFVHPTAFSKLENLKILDLKDNLITEMSRDMLPNPAQQLRTLDLSGNLLNSLLDDMFEGIPNLKELELNFNKFKTLNEETFLWPFEHLQSLHFKGNDFLCDCRLRWLVEVRKPMSFQGECALPENLNGVSLKDISKKGDRHSTMLFLLLSVLLAVILPSLCLCPNQEDIVPCVCKDLGNGPMMMCSNLTSAEELLRPVKGTSAFKMFSLVVINSALLYIPSTVFVNTVFERIRFANSQIMSLSDGDLAFVGLEDHLEEIRASDARYITQWDWSQLKDLRKLKLIDIVDIAMYSVDQEMPELKSLTSLGISKAEISFVHPTAFSKLVSLKRLSLANNEITEVSRTMFPDPAPALFIMDLSDNKLESLPNDIFTNMPNLNEVEINNNKLITLNEETFQWIFKNLQSLMIDGNEIRCDCRLKWMVGMRMPFYFKGACFQPDHMKGVSLKNLNDKVLVC